MMVFSSALNGIDQFQNTVMSNLFNVLRYVRYSVIVRIIKRSDVVVVPELMNRHQAGCIFGDFPVNTKKTVNIRMIFQILQNKGFFFGRIGYAKRNQAKIFG